jgi:putative DNA-invertase from lambdoid prophage Rac
MHLRALRQRLGNKTNTGKGQVGLHYAGSLCPMQECLLEPPPERRQDEMTRAALYLRISTGKQETENQEYLLREFAGKVGWEVVAVYRDEISGSKSERDRPGFRAMMDGAARREFDVLTFFALDRLSREGALPTLTYLQRLDSYGVAWRSYSEPYLDSTGIFKDAVLAILAVIAKQERIRLSERTKAGLARARREGKTLGRPRVAADAAVIREMRQAGQSWSAIARQSGITRQTCKRLAGL